MVRAKCGWMALQAGQLGEIMRRAQAAYKERMAQKAKGSDREAKLEGQDEQ